MADYKEMYLKMVRATEEAINCLIAVQRECEEMYLTGEEEAVLPFPLRQELTEFDKVQ